MFKLIGETEIDTNKIKAVKIYTYKIKNNGKIKDSTLIEHQNFDFFSTFENHVKYQIKYDSLGRDFESYATRVKTGKTYLNYRKIYDSKSKITKTITYNRDGKINSKAFYYYDSLDRLTKTEKYYGYFLYEKPILQQKKVFEYESKTLVKETEFISSITSDNFKSKNIKEFNIKGQQINNRTETIQNDSIISFWGFKSFYKKEKLIRTEKYDSENNNIVTEYSYNSMNLPIENYSFDLNTKNPKEIIRYFYLENRKNYAQQ